MIMVQVVQKADGGWLFYSSRVDLRSKRTFKLCNLEENWAIYSMCREISVVICLF